MHEQSETVQKNGKWVNVYGKNTAKAGQQLPGSGTYDNVDKAVEAARTRSALGENANFLEEDRPPRKREKLMDRVRPDEP